MQLFLPPLLPLLERRIRLLHEVGIADREVREIEEEREEVEVEEMDRIVGLGEGGVIMLEVG